ncbi:unnamed protein product [Calicophoron daubneyi]|uniref:CDP-diacylglycerol--inositol 3-phosphatidyltransferase n=1 Tax=Calicophoron daubneyi TaxID=300641 RepID=A0AAV2U017_CALDB
MSSNCIFLFVPNIIGYLRIILLLYSCWTMPKSCTASVLAYAISGLLDALDGHAARRLNQSTKFGAMLDMLVDRCASMSLLACLIVFYPNYMFAFQMVMIVDIASHWLHVHASVSSGAKSHKAIDLSGNPLLRTYYTNRSVLFWMCAGNEAFFSALYFYHFHPGPTIFGHHLCALLVYLTAPVALSKFCISLVQLYAAAVNMGHLDAKERAGTEKAD